MAYGSITARSFVLASLFGSAKRSGAPATLYFALLYTATPGTLGTEATGGSYARIAKTNDDALWTITNEVMTTDVEVRWPTSTASWNASPLNQWAVFDASTAGTCWAFDALTVPIDVSVANRTPVQAAGDLVVTQGA